MVVKAKSEKGVIRVGNITLKAAPESPPTPLALPKAVPEDDARPRPAEHANHPREWFFDGICWGRLRAADYLPLTAYQKCLARDRAATEFVEANPVVAMNGWPVCMGHATYEGCKREPGTCPWIHETVCRPLPWAALKVANMMGGFKWQRPMTTTQDQDALNTMLVEGNENNPQGWAAYRQAVLKANPTFWKKGFLKGKEGGPKLWYDKYEPLPTDRPKEPCWFCGGKSGFAKHHTALAWNHCLKEVTTARAGELVNNFEVQRRKRVISWYARDTEVLEVTGIGVRYYRDCV
jgi:hypothetical protein